MKYKMIALDLDGTLNNDDHIITPKTREALIAVQKRFGVTVVLASGRQAPGLKRESDALELEKHHGLLLSYGGGRIEDATTQAVLFSRSLSNELAVRFLRHLEKFSVSPVVDNGRAIVTTCEQNYKVQDESRNNNMDVLVVDNIADAIERAGVCPVKILTAAQNDIDMLKFAGCGVAMGNACEELKAIADEVTLDNNHDGIAETLKKHFDI